MRDPWTRLGLGLAAVLSFALRAEAKEPPAAFSIEERSFMAVPPYTEYGRATIRVDGRKLRVETPTHILIIRADQGVVLSVQPGEGTYVRRTLPEWNSALFGDRAFSTWGGWPTLAYLLDRERRDPQITRFEEPDGGARYRVLSPFAKSDKDGVDLWISGETGLPTRMRSAWGAGVYVAKKEWSKPAVGPQPSELFELSKDWHDLTPMAALSFAFADAKGQRLKAPQDPDDELGFRNPEQATRAICTGNRSLAVRFSEQHESSDGGTGRDSSHNFDEVAGPTFKVMSGTVPGDESCLVGPEQYFNMRRLLAFQRLKGDAGELASCEKETLERLRATKQRSVRSCWPIARIEGVGRLLGTEFEPRGRERLAALVLETPDQLVFDEYPAKDDPSEVWRAGDGGNFAPDGFELLFVLHDSDSKELDLGVLWFAEEGSSLTVLRVQGSRFVAIKHGYRYQAPM